MTMKFVQQAASGQNNLQIASFVFLEFSAIDHFRVAKHFRCVIVGPRISLG